MVSSTCIKPSVWLNISRILAVVLSKSLQFPVTSTAVDQTGYWSADLSDVEAGVYTLRLDQLDQSGKVSSRIESPFKREDRNVLADQMKDIASPARINVITVQPGNTLWAISRER